MPIHVAHDPPDAGAELRRLVGADAVLFPQNGEGIAGRLADASARVLARAGGPLLIVWPDLPRFRAAHAAGALERPEPRDATWCLGRRSTAACTWSGLPVPLPELFALPEQTWRHDVMGVALTAIRDVGFEVGILRAERALHRPADLRAAWPIRCFPGTWRRSCGEAARASDPAAGRRRRPRTQLFVQFGLGRLSWHVGAADTSHDAREQPFTPQVLARAIDPPLNRPCPAQRAIATSPVSQAAAGVSRSIGREHGIRATGARSRSVAKGIHTHRGPGQRVDHDPDRDGRGRRADHEHGHHR